MIIHCHYHLCKNGTPISLSTEVYTSNGHSMIPLRKMIAIIHPKADVTWKDGITVVYYGKNKFYFLYKEQKLCTDTSPMSSMSDVDCHLELRNNTLFMEVRASEAMNDLENIYWDDINKVVHFRIKKWMC